MLSRSWLILILALVFGLHCALLCMPAPKKPPTVQALAPAPKTLISFSSKPQSKTQAKKEPKPKPAQSPQDSAQKPPSSRHEAQKKPASFESAKNQNAQSRPENEQKAKAPSQEQESQSAQRQEALKKDYLAEVREAIERHKSYPLVSKRLGEQGVVRLAFCVEASGEFCNMRVASSSGFARLDAAALRALTQARAHKPTPGQKRLELWLDVSFVIGD